jgi:hypothetical protein
VGGTGTGSRSFSWKSYKKIFKFYKLPVGNSFASVILAFSCCLLVI